MWIIDWTRLEGLSRPFTAQLEDPKWAPPPPVLFSPPVIQSSPLAHHSCSPVALLVLLSLMSAQTTLCHLPNLFWILATAVSASAYTSPWRWEWHLFLAQVWREARGCHLANPSGALYASDLHVSTCSKYNLLAFVEESWSLWLPVGDTGTAEWETQSWKERGLPGKHFCMEPTVGLQRPIHNVFQNSILLKAIIASTFTENVMFLADSLLSFFLENFTRTMFNWRLTKVCVWLDGEYE